MDYLDKFTELAAEPIFTYTDWFEAQSRYTYEHRKNVTADLFCYRCNKEKTFVGKAYSREELKRKYQEEKYSSYKNHEAPFSEKKIDEESVNDMINECIFPVGDTLTVQLKCPTCNTIAYINYLIEFAEEQPKWYNKKNDEMTQWCRVHKIGEYPNQEVSRFQTLNKYTERFPKEYSLLTQAERAYRASLGAGAIIYLRKAYETLLIDILKEYSTSIPNIMNFRQLVKLADETAHIIPIELHGRAYGLFGELSDISHADTNDKWGLDKFENLRDVFITILNNILDKERAKKLASEIKLDTAGKVDKSKIGVTT